MHPLDVAQEQADRSRYALTETLLAFRDGTLVDVIKSRQQAVHKQLEKLSGRPRDTDERVQP